jgi:hypothetical protein
VEAVGTAEENQSLMEEPEGTAVEVNNTNETIGNSRNADKKKRIM